MKAPNKPFPSYKWRWAVLTPTEGLNDSRVYLGVLRVLKAHEGEKPNSPGVTKALRVVESETDTHVNLGRSESRNLIRNSGQYWKALGLLGDDRGKIALTAFGRRVAEGQITKKEFAATVIKTLELPNRNIEVNTTSWDNNGIKIKPLELILQILCALQEKVGSDSAFITPEELVKIIIPLAGVKAALDDHVKALQMNRSGLLNLDEWPDCAPRSNDKRMAREFLLFLWYYDICDLSRTDCGHEKFMLTDPSTSEVQEFLQLDLGVEDPSLAVQKVRESHFPETSERKRVLMMLARPQQPAFRKKVLKACQSRCLLTGASLEMVLEAAHIIPVRYGDDYRVENGLCLRSDIHLLFDSGHLRIDPTGKVHLSEVALKDYNSLPSQVKLPHFVNMELIERRWKYHQ